MNKFQSVVQQRGTAAFPAWTGEKVYMRPFTKRDGLPFDLARWQPTVDAMLDGIDTDGPIYLMIDQGVVRAGMSHRRPGVHIDGYWVPSIDGHGGHRASLSGWDTGNGRWKNSEFREPEAIVLASTVQAARAYSGEFSGQPAEGGDCAHIDLSQMQPHDMQSGIVYAGNVTMLHESVPILVQQTRTLVRLNIPGWHPN